MKPITRAALLGALTCLCLGGATPLIASPRSDVELQARIENRLSLDPHLGATTEIDVQVSNSQANLGGVVENWSQHRDATHDAFQAGASTVVNHLRVRSDPVASERRFIYTQDPVG